MVVNVWKRTLNLEWWRYKVETKSQEVSQLQKAWLENEEKKEAGDTSRTPASKRAASMAFKIDNIEDDDMPSKAREKPEKGLKEEHNHLAVGGMRNPAKSVKRLTQLAGVGRKLALMWDEFLESHPKAIEVAEFHEETLTARKEALKDNLVKIQERPTVIKENWEFKSPLNADLWEQWGEEAADPDGVLPATGSPFGNGDTDPLEWCFSDGTRHR